MKNRIRMLMLCTFMCMISLEALAQAGTPAEPSVCTTMSERADQIFSNPAPGPNEPKGVLTEIFDFIKDVTGEATRNIFSAFTSNPNYTYAVRATFSLYIVMFGAMFLMGIVQATFGQVLQRLIRMGIIMALMDPTGWDFFNSTVVAFFNDGSDDIIRAVMNIATGQPAGANQFASPFYRLDRIATFLINPDTLATLLGTATSGVYSMAMTGFLMLAFFGFMRLLITALQTYAIAFVVRSMLLGLAPIFFVFLLFERTKNLFTGWINLLVGFSLKPVLLFTFLSFMVVMIQSATVNMMGGTKLCWVTTQEGEGINSQKANWRFVDERGQPYLLDWGFNGNVQCQIEGQPANEGCPQFPVKIIDVLTFFLLVWLAMRFADVIDTISNQLSSTFASLSADTRLATFLNSSNAEGVGTAGGGVQQGAAGQPTVPRKTP